MHWKLLSLTVVEFNKKLISLTICSNLSSKWLRLQIRNISFSVHFFFLNVCEPRSCAAESSQDYRVNVFRQHAGDHYIAQWIIKQCGEKGKQAVRAFVALRFSELLMHVRFANSYDR